MTYIKLKKDSRFAHLGSPKRIWAISAIHGQLDPLITLHNEIFPHITPGDKIVYTGNYMGYGPNTCGVLDEILAFRRAVLARPSMIPDDLIYLRGAQEEMWQKLLQLQFSPAPMDSLVWMLGNGITASLSSYGFSQHDGMEACRQGMKSITEWSLQIRKKFAGTPGHDIFTTHLVRAAYTNKENDFPLLFVNAGIDYTNPLDEQKDSFWWEGNKFDIMMQQYSPFTQVIRGYDPKHNGLEFSTIKTTIDGGCGFDGNLICAVFDVNGEIIDLLECR